MRHSLACILACTCLAILTSHAQEQKDATAFAVEQCGDIDACNKLAQAGNAEAQYRVAKWHQFEDKSDKHFEEAAKWYKLAAEQNHREAQFRLANLYIDGQGLPASYSSYLIWIEKSAKNGYSYAEYMLGDHYGLSVYGNFGMKEPDYKEALIWYLKAAEQGHVFAQTKAGFYFLKGLGTKKDLARAYFWLGIARDRNFGPANKVLEENKKKFTPDITIHGEDQIKQWKLEHPAEVPFNVPQSFFLRMP